MEWLKKTKNAFSKCVLEFNFAPISGPYFFIKKKKSKSMYPNVHVNQNEHEHEHENEHYMIRT
jgi:hypothetical protein